MKTINASDITRGMTIRYPVHFLPFTSRKLDHDGFHYDCVDGVITNDDGEIVVFGFDKVVRLPASQYVHVISE